MTDETEVLRVRLYEAEKRRRAKAENLSKSIARLAKIQGNRRKPARVGGKTLEDEVQEQIKKLQEELHEEEQGVEAMTNELQVLQESVEPLSAGPLQTTESKTGENTTLPMDDEVHQQELNSNQDNKATHGRASAHTSNTDPAGTAESTNIEVNGLTVTINKDPQLTPSSSLSTNSMPTTSHEGSAGAAEPAISTNTEAANGHLQPIPPSSLSATSVPTASHEGSASAAEPAIFTNTEAANNHLQPIPPSNLSATSVPTTSHEGSAGAAEPVILINTEAANSHLQLTPPSSLSTNSVPTASHEGSAGVAEPAILINTEAANSHLQLTPPPCPLATSAPTASHKTAYTDGIPPIFDLPSNAGPVQVLDVEPTTSPNHGEVNNVQGGNDNARNQEVRRDPSPGPTPSLQSSYAASLPAGTHHAPISTSSTPAVQNEVHAEKPKAAIQSSSTNKFEAKANLLKKRRAEDPDNNLKHNTKRLKRVGPSGSNPHREHLKEKLRGRITGPHTTGKKSRGEGALLKNQEKLIKAVKRPNTHTRAPQVPLTSQHVAESEDSEEWGGIQHDDDGGNSTSSEETDIAQKDTEMESPGDGKGPDEADNSETSARDHPMEGASIFDFDSSPPPDSAALANIITDNEDDLLLQSMRLVDEDDKRDLKKTLLHHVPSIPSQALALRSEIARKRSSGTSQTQGKSSATRESPTQKESKQNTQAKKKKAVVKKGKASAPRQVVKGKGVEGKQVQGADNARGNKVEEPTAVTEGAGLAATVDSGNADKEEDSQEEWAKLSEKDKAEQMAIAREAIRGYLSFKTDIPFEIRSQIRSIEEFCPEAASTTKALALHCLTSRFGNTVCLYHFIHDKAGRINDAKPQRNYQVTGVPWARAMNPRNRPSNTSLRELPPKAIHCGCHQDDVLWDFFWWKNTRLYSPTLHITEDWGPTGLEPRGRGFMVTFLQQFTHTKLRDIYSGTLDEHRTKLHLLKKMEENIGQVRKDLELEMMRLAVESSDSSDGESESD